VVVEGGACGWTPVVLDASASTSIDGHGGAQQRQLQHSGCRDSELHSLHDILQV